MNTAKHQQSIVVHITKSSDQVTFDLAELEELVKSVCHRFNVFRAIISIVIVDDAEIRRINKRYLNCNRSTDVISFDLSEEDEDSEKVFDLIVNAEMACSEARRRGHPHRSELALYVTHGLLHNLGFDDSTAEQAEKMHETEDDILRQQGFGSVYDT